ncbi:MAG TPA: transglycosylase SLT domain-containing protein [Actinoplanes sp.]
MNQNRRRRVGWCTAAAVMLMITAGCGLTPQSDISRESAAQQPVATDTAEPSDEPLVEPTPSETTVKPSKRPSKKPTRKATATPTEDPNNFQAPECATYDGKKVSKAKAKAALVNAAGRTYWPIQAPKLKVPLRLVKAVAWHESGWQSNIVNCDGGRGLMQVMPGTVDQMNTRFVKSYDATDYRDNAYLGANYLAWLTKYFAEHYFKDTYNLSSAKCRSSTDHRCLLNMVIAGYNAGAGAVDAAHAKKRLPNPEYVRVVRALMADCYCDRY